MNLMKCADRHRKIMLLTTHCHGGGLGSSTKIFFVRNCVKCGDLQIKIKFFTTQYHGGGMGMGCQEQKIMNCSRNMNCMKCVDLYRKFCF